MQKKTICLNMIVKDESEVIERCLASLKDLIDYWVIVDTGSTDGTQEMIVKYLKDIPGQLHDRPWVDFAHNRNEALDLAKGKGDYLLLIDADEVLHRESSFVLPQLDKDYYCIPMRSLNMFDARRATFIKNALPWRWVGVLHEILSCPQVLTFEWLAGMTNFCDLGGGARSKDPDKFLRDVQVLKKGLEKEPNNSRYVYYLGRSYFCAEKYDLALPYYEKRVAMQGEPEETYLSWMDIAHCQERLKVSMGTLVDTFFKAYACRPTRAEPLFRAAMLYRENGNPFLGYLVSKFALTIPRPANDLVVSYVVYDYGLMLEFSNCALFANRTKEGLEACATLLANPNVPADIKESLKMNWNIAKSRLIQELEQEKPAFTY